MNRRDQDGLNITILGLNYAPEPTGIAPYTTGLARGLAERHRVQVVTGQPHYPAWTVSDAFGKAVTTKDGDVGLRRVAHGVPSDPSNLRRTRMELSFGLRSTMSSWHRPDVVLCVSPALFAVGTSLMRARWGARRPATAVWVQDLYSLGVKETGSSGALGTRAVSWIESKVLRSADGVAVIHDAFAHHVTEQLGVDPARVRRMRNWSHVDVSAATPPQAIRERFGWQPDETVVLHAGNMGVKQGLENVVEAARLADTMRRPVRFVLLGDGRERAALEEAGRGVQRLQFLPTLDDADFMGALGAADVLLVNEKAGVEEMSVPSKLTSYFTSARPVLGAVSPRGAAASEVTAAGAGVVVGSGDPLRLLDAAVQLGGDLARRKELGENGRLYAERELARDAQITRWSDWVEELALAPARQATPAVVPA